MTPPNVADRVSELLGNVQRFHFVTQATMEAVLSDALTALRNMAEMEGERDAWKQNAEEWEAKNRTLQATLFAMETHA